MLGVLKKIFWGKEVGGGGGGGGNLKLCRIFRIIFQIIVGLFDIRVTASLNSVTENAVTKQQRIFSIKFKSVREESEEKFCWP